MNRYKAIISLLQETLYSSSFKRLFSNNAVAANGNKTKASTRESNKPLDFSMKDFGPQHKRLIEQRIGAMEPRHASLIFELAPEVSYAALKITESPRKPKKKKACSLPDSTQPTPVILQAPSEADSASGAAPESYFLEGVEQDLL